MIFAVIHKLRFFGLPLLVGLALLFQTNAGAQTRKRRDTRSVNELAKLREEFIKSTKDYKTSLARLIAIYERNVTNTEQKLVQTQELFAEGLISKADLVKAEAEVLAAKDKVRDSQTQMKSADTLIADTMMEAEAEAQIAKTHLGNGRLLRTTSYIRFSGDGSWALSEAWKVQRFFMDSFKKQLPVGVFGQGAIHDRWRLDHRNAMDVSLHPDGPEGQLLMNYLRSNGIPFLAFRAAIPGTATGPHIHIGRPSHRY